MTMHTMPSAYQRAQATRAAGRVSGPCGMAIAIAAAFCNHQESEIAAPTRSSASVCDARHIAMYLAHVVFQCPARQIADAFRRDRTSIGHALRRVEDRRDDPTFDAFLARMERFAESCRDMMASPWEAGR